MEVRPFRYNQLMTNIIHTFNLIRNIVKIKENNFIQERVNEVTNQFLKHNDINVLYIFTLSY